MTRLIDILILLVALMMSIASPVLAQAENSSRLPSMLEASEPVGDPLLVGRLTHDFPTQIRSGVFTPFPLSIQSGSLEFKGEVTLRSSNVSRSSALYRHPFEIGPHTRKILWPCFRPTGSNLVVQILNEEKDIVFSEEYRADLSSSAGMVVLVVGDLEGVKSSTAGVRINLTGPLTPWESNWGKMRDQISVLSFGQKTLPDQWQALEFANAIVIADANPADLSTSQAATLRTYVEAGGHLLLSYPSGDSGNALVQDWDFLPVELLGTSLNDDLSPLSSLDRSDERAAFQKISFTAAQVAVRPGAQILAGTAEKPLVVRWNLGLGRVTYLNFDITLPPFRGSLAAPSILSSLLAPASSLRYHRPGLDYAAINTVNNLCPAQQVSIPTIVLFLSLYLFTIGPLNYFVLSRKDRKERAAITIPIISIVFLAGAYGLGFAIKGTTSHLSKLEIALLPEEDGPARVESFFGLYSTGVVSYDLDFQSSLSALADFQPYNAWGGRSSVNLEANVLTEDTFRIRNVQTTMWSQRYLRGMSLEEIPVLSMQVSREKGKAYGVKTRNEIGKFLEAGILLKDGKYLSLRSLDLGTQDHQVDRTNINQVNRSLIASDSRGTMRQPSTFRNSEIDHEVAVVEGLGQAIQWSPEDPTKGLFVGVLDEPLAPIQIDGKPRKAATRVLVIKEVRINE